MSRSAPRDARLYEALDSPEDHRSRCERDRDRVLYTTALRRLAGITQVVSPTEGILFHNRLTHTLEVAAIGRRLGQKFARNPALVAALGGLDPECVEAACLIHDLGHPPFGHTAEKELDRLVTQRGLTDGFEGNAQAFRIVTKLAVRVQGFHGLDLTRATLNASLKYPWKRGTYGPDKVKWGFYGTEEDEFNWAREPFSLGRRRSPEAELMDWADDVAYAVHDVEDFYRAGIVPLNQLIKDEKERDRFLDFASKRLRAEYSRDDLADAANRVISSFPLLQPYQGTYEHRSRLRSYTASLIGRYVNAIEFNTSGSSWKIERETIAEMEVNLLQQLIWYYVILDPSLGTQQYGQRKVIRELFEGFCKAADEGPSGVDWNILPKNYQEEINNAANKDERTRIVTDIIASMTEQQAVSMHQRLTGVSPGTVRDRLIFQ